MSNTEPFFANYVRPTYIPNFVNPGSTKSHVQRLIDECPWLKVREARQECFFAHEPTTYTYGKGENAKSYDACTTYHPLVWDIEEQLNVDGVSAPKTHCAYNVCFLNRYDSQQNQLGWHADDSPGMLHEHPIAVVSFGQPREIWWRLRDMPGVVPMENRQLLEDGSLFVMPPGFQRTHEHRIPKGDRVMKPRVSLTFRRYVP